jgi:hypothetical protein
VFGAPNGTCSARGVGVHVGVSLIGVAFGSCACWGALFFTAGVLDWTQMPMSSIGRVVVGVCV